MTMPNFLIIGAAKAGTSSLHFWLAQHPEVYMTPDKQTYFFASEGDPPGFEGPGDREHAQRKRITRLEDYQALFEGVTTEKAIGEACAVYLYDPMSPACIRRHVPDAKLIIVLRDPAERAYSSYMQMVRDGYETIEDFSEALRLEEDRIKDNWRHLWHYKARGFYHDQIKRYFALFDSSQIRIYMFDDLKRNPAELVKDLLRYLEVDGSFVPDTSRKYNASGVPESRTLFNLIMLPNPLKTLGKPLFPKAIRDRIKDIVTTNPTLLRKPPMPPEVRRQLVDEYREDTLKLQDLIGRDLSHWLVY